MITYLFYTKQSEGERKMAELADRLSRRDVKAQLVDADSIDGLRLVELYDLMIRPSVIIVRDDGNLVQSWADQDQLPTVEEISYFSHL